MAVNKIIYNAQVLIDLTNDTVAADNLLAGYAAHDASGAAITGTLTFAMVYTGSGEPSASTGADGDIYLDLG